MKRENHKGTKSTKIINLIFVPLWFFLLMLTAETVLAQQDTVPDSPRSLLKKIELTGFVDVYYGYNFTDTQGDTQLRNFDVGNRQLKLNLAAVALEKKATPDSRVGFRLDLTYITGIEESFVGDLGLSDPFKNVPQAYVSYLAPVGRGLQIDLGQFFTYHGKEVLATRDNWNYSRSLITVLGVPCCHFGARLTYPFNDKFTLSTAVHNGWNNYFDNNHSRSFSIGTTITPNSKISIYQNYTGGPEQPNNDKDWRHLFDTIVIYSHSKSLSLAANYLYGFDRVTGARVRWQGVSGYARYQLNGQFAIAPRFDWFDDHDGFMTGTRQTLKSVTITGEHTIKWGLFTRIEYRLDLSDEKFFKQQVDRFSRTQSTLVFGIVYGFSSKL